MKGTIAAMTVLGVTEIRTTSPCSRTTPGPSWEERGADLDDPVKALHCCFGG